MRRPLLGRPRGATAASGRRRLLQTAVLLSVAFHLAGAGLIVLLPRLLPHDAPPQDQGTVELLMVEQKGSLPTQEAQPQDGKPAPPEQQPTQPAQAAPASPAVPAPKALENGEVTGPPLPAEQPPAPPAKPEVRQTANQMKVAAPEPPRSAEAPVFDLEGTDSESNAIALGPQILPAMPDNRFRNRPPVYPAEAEMRGDHGSVVVLIHVSEDGVATGVDVAESSGVLSLDQAAVAAVRKWHFHPAMKAGHTMPFDMPFRFIFQAD